MAVPSWLPGVGGGKENLASIRHYGTSAILTKSVQGGGGSGGHKRNRVEIKVDDGAAVTWDMKLLAELEDACRVVNCPICLDPFTAPVLLDCGHAFCGDCSRSALEAKAICPYCNVKVSLETREDKRITAGAAIFRELASELAKLKPAGASKTGG